MEQLLAGGVIRCLMKVYIVQFERITIQGGGVTGPSIPIRYRKFNR